MCNFVEYSGGSAAAEFENAVKVATSMNAAGLIMLNKASLLSMKLQRVSMDPVPYSIPTAFIPDSDAASVSFHACALSRFLAPSLQYFWT